jgi:hypothetical protein
MQLYSTYVATDRAGMAMGHPLSWTEMRAVDGFVVKQINAKD